MAATVTGQVTAKDGARWTVQGADGKRYTVVTSDQTRFGSTKHPANAATFAVGSAVEVAGTLSGTTITATKVRKASTGKHHGHHNGQ